MAERVYCLYRGKDQESILMQKNACHDFAEKKGWNIVDEEQEIGVSGYKAVSYTHLDVYKRQGIASVQNPFTDRNMPYEQPFQPDAGDAEAVPIFVILSPIC